MPEYVTRKEEVTAREDTGGGFFLERVREHVEVKLKHCPCCGHEGRTEHIETPEDGEQIVVTCPECGVSTAFYEDYEPAAQAWNHRSRPLDLKGSSVGSCPFCGKKAVCDFCPDPDGEEDNLDFQYIACTNCGAHTSAFKDGRKAVMTWNARV